MRAIEMYEADDGSLHRSRHSCEETDRNVRNAKLASLVLQAGGSLLVALRAYGATWIETMPQADLADLDRITRETGLVIEHWQLSREPAYRIAEINKHGQVWVSGTPRRTWSGGGYGSWLNPGEVLRLARETFTANQESHP